MAEKYTPYKPTPAEARIDSAIATIAPAWAYRRIVARESAHRFRYLSAQSNESRRNSPVGTGAGDTIQSSREKAQIMWNAIELVQNSGLASSIRNKFATYICGRLRYQARTGDNTINNEYESYMQLKCARQIDFTGRFSLRQICMLIVDGMMVKGDIGQNFVRQGPDLFLQGIEADRIGNPNDWGISSNYIRGLNIDDAGRIISARVFSRDRRNGVYKEDKNSPFPMWDAVGLPRFRLIANPITFDDYRGVSVFKTAIDNATYIERMRNYELQAMLWASSQSGVYYTKSGALPDTLPFDKSPEIDQVSGKTIERYQVKPNTVTALQAGGEKVEMFPHERPSPNVLGMYRDTIRDICVGCDLTYGFVWDPSGLTGPAVRQMSAQDGRTIERWQELLRESFLDWVSMMILGNAIANKELTYHPQWFKGQWFFPPKTTIDVGRESTANISERNAALNDGASIAAENSQDIDEIQKQLGIETDQMIGIAMDISTRRKIPWQVIYNMLQKPSGGGGKTGGGVVLLPDAPGATSDGAEIGDGEEEPNGEDGPPQQMRHVITLRHQIDNGVQHAVSANGSNGGGQLELKLSDAHPATAAIIRDSVSQFADDFPNAARRLKSISTKSSFSDEGYTRFYDDKDGSIKIFINKSQAQRNPRELDDEAKEQKKIGLFATDTYRGTVEHELGHILHDHILESDQGANFASELKKLKEEDGGKLSDYSKVSAAEFFAEAFAKMRTSGPESWGKSTANVAALLYKTGGRISYRGDDGQFHFYSPDQERDDHGRFEDEGREGDRPLPGDNNSITKSALKDFYYGDETFDKAERTLFSKLPDESISDGEFNRIVNTAGFRKGTVGEAIRAYTGDKYGEINRNPNSRIAQRLTAALRKVKPDGPETLYRGMVFTKESDALSFVADLTDEDKTTELNRTLTSFSKNKDTAEIFSKKKAGYKVFIKASAKSGRSLDLVAGNNRDEKEVVMLAGSKFKQVSINVSADKKRYDLELQEI